MNGILLKLKSTFIIARDASFVLFIISKSSFDHLASCEDGVSCIRINGHNWRITLRHENANVIVSSTRHYFEKLELLEIIFER